jgi:hypothetical protein
LIANARIGALVAQEPNWTSPSWEPTALRTIAVTESLGLGPDEEAVKSLQTWKFEPATLEGKPVALKIAVQVDFRLD